MISERQVSQNPLIAAPSPSQLDLGGSYEGWGSGVSPLRKRRGGPKPPKPLRHSAELRVRGLGTADRRPAVDACFGGHRAAFRLHRDGIEHSTVPHLAAVFIWRCRASRQRVAMTGSNR